MITSLDDLIRKLQEQTDAVERAKIIRHLHEDKELSLKEISTYLKKHSTYVSHYLRILDLPEIVLDGYYAKQISSAHLFILSRLKEKADILKAYESILAKNLTSAQTEELIREIKYSVATTQDQLSTAQIASITRLISKAFPGVELKIIQTRVKGKIVLELKGETKKTSEFIKDIADMLTKREYPDMYEDTLQVLE